MVLPQYTNQVFFRDVGISLSRNDGGVTKKLLHHSHISTIPQEQGGHGMPKHVRSDVALYPSTLP